MKKKFYLFFSFCILIVCAFFVNGNINSSIYAYSGVTSISSALYYTNSPTESPIENTNNTYVLNFNQNFNENNIISSTNSPYGTYVVGTYVNLDGRLYEELEVNEQQEIFNDMKWVINGTTIVFNNYQFFNNSFAVKLNTSFSKRVNLEITPYQAGYITVCTYLGETNSSNNLKSEITLNCNYATPTNAILLTAGGNLNQLYEEYQEICFTALLNFSDFLNPDANYTYIWKLNEQILNETSNILILNKSDIKIGQLTITVEIQQLTNIFASEIINISTNVDEEITIIQTGGSTTQTLGQNNQPILFEASIPVTGNYTVTWFLKSPDSNIYKKQETTTKNYSFNPLEHNFGNYKVFAQISYQNKLINSNVYLIEIKPKEITQDVVFTITYKEYANTDTNVTGFECTINTEEYYKEEDIIWSIDGVQWAQGSKFNFEPSLADEYVISVKLKNQDGTVSSPQFTVVTATAIHSISIWIYIAIAFAVLTIMSILSIIITNKAREKIW